MDRDPEPGVMIGDVRLVREVAGAMGCAIYAGVGATGRNVLVTVGPQQRHPLARVRAELAYEIEGVAPCVGVIAESSPSSTWHAVIEEVAAGVPLAELAPLPDATVIALVSRIAAIAELAHASGRVLYGIHPRLCFGERDGTWTTMAPRAIQFLLGMPAMRGGLCLEEVYLPLEVWRDRTATPADDVFAACALGHFLVTGRHPFAGATFDEAIAAVARGAPQPAATALGALLARGLGPAQHRPTAAELRAALLGL